MGFEYRPSCAAKPKFHFSYRNVLAVSSDSCASPGVFHSRKVPVTKRRGTLKIPLFSRQNRVTSACLREDFYCSKSHFSTLSPFGVATMSSATEVSRTGMTHETLQRLLAAQQLSCNVEWVELVLFGTRPSPEFLARLRTDKRCKAAFDSILVELSKNVQKNSRRRHLLGRQANKQPDDCGQGKWTLARFRAPPSIAPFRQGGISSEANACLLAGQRWHRQRASSSRCPMLPVALPVHRLAVYRQPAYHLAVHRPASPCRQSVPTIKPNIGGRGSIRSTCNKPAEKIDGGGWVYQTPRHNPKNKKIGLVLTL